MIFSAFFRRSSSLITLFLSFSVFISCISDIMDSVVSCSAAFLFLAYSSMCSFSIWSIGVLSYCRAALSDGEIVSSNFGGSQVFVFSSLFSFSSSCKNYGGVSNFFMLLHIVHQSASSNLENPVFSSAAKRLPIGLFSLGTDIDTYPLSPSFHSSSLDVSSSKDYYFLHIFPLINSMKYCPFMSSSYAA